jgi:CBS domain-containing protein
MGKKIRDVMTDSPHMLAPSATVEEAARLMRDADIGDVLVFEDDAIRGIVTDRDITLRVVAEGNDITNTTLGEICTSEVITVAPDDSEKQAVRLMREHAVRRLPVVDNGRPVGIVSIGDLAIDLDTDSALADISAAPANN